MVDKTDMERIGLFKEMPYVTINDPYQTPLHSSIDRGMIKGRQILCEGKKTKDATDDGYFLKPFVRIFEGEGESNIIKIRRQWRNLGSQNKPHKPFIPSFYGRMQSGVGSRMGCMDNNLIYFSSVKRDERKKEREKRNILTNPGKKGSGYGYLDVCINPYPSAGIGDGYDRAKELYHKREMEEHKAKTLNRREFIPSNGYGGYFDPNPYIDLSGKNYKVKILREPSFVQKRAFIPSSYPKKTGGCKAGTIDPYPESVRAEYRDKELAHLAHDIRNNKGKLFIPNPGMKSCIYVSVLHKNVDFRVKNLNSQTIEKVMDY